MEKAEKKCRLFNQAFFVPLWHEEAVKIRKQLIVGQRFSDQGAFAI
jgi:hypothetical protein